jgi:hypothetical protein
MYGREIGLEKVFVLVLCVVVVVVVWWSSIMTFLSFRLFCGSERWFCRGFCEIDLMD